MQQASTKENQYQARSECYKQWFKKIKTDFSHSKKYMHFIYIYIYIYIYI